jgi:hypothetical protein
MTPAPVHPAVIFALAALAVAGVAILLAAYAFVAVCRLADRLYRLEPQVDWTTNVAFNARPAVAEAVTDSPSDEPRPAIRPLNGRQVA